MCARTLCEYVRALSDGIHDRVRACVAGNCCALDLLRLRSRVVWIARQRSHVTLFGFGRGWRRVAVWMQDVSRTDRTPFGVFSRFWFQESTLTTNPVPQGCCSSAGEEEGIQFYLPSIELSLTHTTTLDAILNDRELHRTQTYMYLVSDGPTY